MLIMSTAQHKRKDIGDWGIGNIGLTRPLPFNDTGSIDLKHDIHGGNFALIHRRDGLPPMGSFWVSGCLAGVLGRSYA